MYRTLRDQSRNCRVPLNFDALEISSASPTLDFIAAHTDPRIDEVGIVLPSRWRRSLEDADRANDLGLVVRVVKGQSADPAEPDRDPRHGFTEVITKLAGRARCVRVASHNALVARESLSLLRAAGTRAELELLYGLPLGNQLALAREFNVPVRVYVAFGHAFLPYAMQSLRRHPGGVLRLLREAARGDCLSGFPVFPGAGPIRSAR
jgi:proline dehydrogenase